MNEMDRTKEDLIAELKALRENIESLKASHQTANPEDNISEGFSESNYSAIFNAANDAIFIHDIDTGQIVDANKKATEMYCYPKEELLNVAIQDMTMGQTPYTGDEMMGFMEKAAKDEPQLFDWVAKDKAGRFFWVEINLKRAVIGGKYRILAIVRDITERKNSEEAIRESEDRYRTLAESARDFIYIIDKELKVQYVNAFAAYWIGEEPESIIDKPLKDIFPAIMYERMAGGLTKVMETGEHFSVEDRMIFQGKDFWLDTVLTPIRDEAGHVISVMGVSRDVTERKEAEEALHIAKFSIEHAGEAIFWVSSDAKILYANDTASEFLGYTHDELLSLRVFDINPTFKTENWNKHWEDLKDRRSITFETEYRKKSGTVFPVEVSDNYMEFNGEEYRCIFVRDITERKKAEESLVRRDYQLEILSRTSQHINAVLETSVILRTLVAAGMELVDATAGMAGLFIKGNMVFTEYNKDGRLQLLDHTLPPGFGVPGLVAQTSKVYISNDPARDSHVSQEWRSSFGFYNLINIPILSGKGELLGCFEMHNKRDHELFDAQDAFMLQGLAASAAVALENAKILAERKKAEEALQNNERFLENVFNSIQDGIGVLDTDLRIIRANPTLEKWHSYAMPIVGKKCYEVYHNRKEPCEKCPTVRAIKSGKAEHEVLERHGADGQAIGWLDLYSYPLFDNETGQLRGIIEYVRDITQRKNAQDELTRYKEHLEELVEERSREVVASKNYLDKIINSIADPIFVKDRQHRWTLLNKSYCEFMGYKLEELIGKSDYDFFPKAEADVFWAKDELVFKTGEENVNEELFTDARKVTHVISTKKVLYKNDNGEEFIVGIIRDITDLKRKEEKIEILNKDLRKIELQQEAILNNIPDMAWLKDRDSRFIEVNQPFGKAAGVKPGELTGKTDFDIWPKEFAEKYRADDIEVMETGQRKMVEERLADKEGKIEWIETVKTPIRNAEGVIVGTTGIARDITEKKKVFEELQKHREHLEKLVKERTKELELLNKELIRSNKRLNQLALKDTQTGLYNHMYLSEVIEPEFHRARRYGHPLSIIMLDIDYFKSINDVYGHDFGDLVLKQFSKWLRKMVRRYDVVVRFGGEEFVVLSSGVDRDKAMSLAHRLLDAINLYNFGDSNHEIKLKVSASIASYPDDNVLKGIDLINLADRILNKVKDAGGNKAYSSIVLKKKTSKAATEESYEDVRFLKDQIEKLTKRGKRSLIESITAFAKTIELKDHYTGEHVEHTVRYATDIAKALDLSGEEIENVRQAAVLHDLGKIGISDRILLKKAKLTKREFEEIKKHPQIAADIIRPIQFMHDIVPLVLYHHERWDGKGYPAGLKGEEIPIGARIIAIADVYQALTSNRPYRKAFAKKEAMSIVRKGAGTQFDPRIVEVFLKILKKEKKQQKKR